MNPLKLVLFVFFIVCLFSCSKSKLQVDEVKTIAVDQLKIVANDKDNLTAQDASLYLFSKKLTPEEFSNNVSIILKSYHPTMSWEFFWAKAEESEYVPELDIQSLEQLFGLSYKIRSVESCQAAEKLHRKLIDKLDQSIDSSNLSAGVMLNALKKCQDLFSQYFVDKDIINSVKKNYFYKLKTQNDSLDYQNNLLSFISIVLKESNLKKKTEYLSGLSEVILDSFKFYIKNNNYEKIYQMNEVIKSYYSIHVAYANREIGKLIFEKGNIDKIYEVFGIDALLSTMSASTAVSDFSLKSSKSIIGFISNKFIEDKIRKQNNSDLSAASFIESYTNIFKVFEYLFSSQDSRSLILNKLNLLHVEAARMSKIDIENIVKVLQEESIWYENDVSLLWLSHRISPAKLILSRDQSLALRQINTSELRKIQLKKLELSSSLATSSLFNEYCQNYQRLGIINEIKTQLSQDDFSKDTTCITVKTANVSKNKNAIFNFDNNDLNISENLIIMSSNFNLTLIAKSVKGGFFDLSNKFVHQAPPDIYPGEEYNPIVIPLLFGISTNNELHYFTYFYEKPVKSLQPLIDHIQLEDGGNGGDLSLVVEDFSYLFGFSSEEGLAQTPAKYVKYPEDISYKIDYITIDSWFYDNDLDIKKWLLDNSLPEGTKFPETQVWEDFNEEYKKNVHNFYDFYMKSNKKIPLVLRQNYIGEEQEVINHYLVRLNKELNLNCGQDDLFNCVAPQLLKSSIEKMIKKIKVGEYAKVISIPELSDKFVSQVSHDLNWNFGQNGTKGKLKISSK